MQPHASISVYEKIASFVQESGFNATLGIQSNGTLIDKSFADILKTFNIQTGISLDGSYDINETLRGKTKSTLKGMRLLTEEKIPFTVTTVITGNNINGISKIPVILAGFKMCHGVGFDLLVRKHHIKNKEKLYLASTEELKINIKKFLEMFSFVNSNSGNLKFRELNKLKKTTSKKFCHAANGTGISVLPNGKVYPCSQTADDPYFYMGEAVDLKSLQKNTRLSGVPSENNPMCISCPLKNNCPLDCPSRLYYNRKDNIHLSCIMYQTIYNFQTSKNKGKSI